MSVLNWLADRALGEPIFICECSHGKNHHFNVDPKHKANDRKFVGNKTDCFIYGCDCKRFTPTDKCPKCQRKLKGIPARLNHCPNCLPKVKA